MINEILRAEIWYYGRGWYKAYSETLSVIKRVTRWESVKLSSIYYYPDFSIKGNDIIFPTKTYNRVAVALGLPKKRKSQGRVKQGQRAQKASRIAQVKSSNLTSAGV